MNNSNPIVISILSLALLLPGMATGQDGQEPEVQGLFVEPPVEDPPSPSVIVLSEIVGHPDLGGITLPEGFYFVDKPGGFCSVYDGIAGPDEFEITYSVWLPAPPLGEPLHSGHYTGGVKVIHPDQCKERYVNGELVELAVLGKIELIVSYPDRAIDLEARVNSEEQFADALMIMLSIPNESRYVSWADAQLILEQCEVETVYQTHSCDVSIRMSNGVIYRTTEPTIDAVFAVLKKCEKYESVGMITE